MPRLWLVICSLWPWGALAMLLILGLPLMALVRLLTAPFDPGRYLTGRIFRLLGASAAVVNPLWRFRWTGQPPAAA